MAGRVAASHTIHVIFTHDDSNFGMFQKGNNMSSLYSMVTQGPTPPDYHDFLLLQGRYRVDVSAMTSWLYLEVLSEFFQKDIIERDRIVCNEVHTVFPEAELDALRACISEYNTQKNPKRRAALAAHIQMLIILYVTFIRAQRNQHIHCKKQKMPHTVQDAFVKRAGKDDLTKEERTAVAMHLGVTGVPHKRLETLMDAYIKEATKTMWVEKPAYRTINISQNHARRTDDSSTLQ